MAINQAYPVLDGIAPSWAGVIIKCSIYDGALLDIRDISAINTGTAVEIGEQRGASGGRVTRRTTGSATPTASMTLYRSGYQKLARNLASVAPKRGKQRLISLVHFDVQVQHTPEGSDEVYEYRIMGCRVMGRDLNGAEGVDADQVELPINTLQIIDIIDGNEVVML